MVTARFPDDSSISAEASAPASAPGRASEPAPGLALTGVRLLPWAVLIGHAVWLASFSLAQGAVLFAALMLPWASLVGLSRRWIRRFRTRMGRLGFDLTIVTVCIALVSLGGISMLPPMTAFTALDVIEPGTRGARRRAGAVLVLVILLAAFPGLLFAFLVWPAALVALLSLLVRPSGIPRPMGPGVVPEDPEPEEDRWTIGRNAEG
jgi:hypothetical protein